MGKRIRQRINGQGLNRQRKRPKAVSMGAGDLAGAKARPIFLPLAARLKPCPCYKAPWIEFFPELQSPTHWIDIFGSRPRGVPSRALVTKPLGLSFSAACEGRTFRL